MKLGGLASASFSSLTGEGAHVLESPVLRVAEKSGEHLTCLPKPLPFPCSQHLPSVGTALTRSSLQLGCFLGAVPLLSRL